MKEITRHIRLEQLGKQKIGDYVRIHSKRGSQPKSGPFDQRGEVVRIDTKSGKPTHILVKVRGEGIKPEIFSLSPRTLVTPQKK